MWDPSKLTVEQRAELLKKVMGPGNRRTLEGIDKEHVFLLLQFLQPVATSSSQRSITYHYEMNGLSYLIHYIGNEVMIEEIENVVPDKY